MFSSRASSDGPPPGGTIHLDLTPSPPAALAGRIRSFTLQVSAHGRRLEPARPRLSRHSWEPYDETPDSHVISRRYRSDAFLVNTRFSSSVIDSVIGTK